MFSWLKILGKSSSWSEPAHYPVEELRWLEKDFKPLDTLLPGVCARIMQFLATGSGPDILQTLTGMRGAGGGLALRCRLNGGRATPDRDRFFASTTIVDPAFHLRLGMVYDAAASFNAPGGQQRVAVAPGLLGGAQFLDAYLWEALAIAPNIYPRKPKPSRLSAVEMEKMLELHGNPPSWLVRAGLVIDPATYGWLNHSGTHIPAIPGFKDALVRHLDTVRDCLNQTDHRRKVHVLEVLQQVQFSPGHCADLAAQLAVSTAKGVREAAEAWMILDVAPVIPHLRRIASEAGPTERFQAVKCLGKFCGQEIHAFLGDLLQAEKSAKVRELIEGTLATHAKGDSRRAGETTGLPLLPPLPDVLADQTLDRSVLQDLQNVIRKANLEWTTAWERLKGQRWAPKQPTHLPAQTAEEWFHLLQTLKNGNFERKLSGINSYSATLIEFAGHPKLKLVHVFRWAVLLVRDFVMEGHTWHNAGLWHFDKRIEKHGPIDYRELAAISEGLGFPGDWIARSWLLSGDYNRGPFNTQAAEFVWPYFAERISLLEKALGWMPDHSGFIPKHWEAAAKLNAWRALATFPAPPPSLNDRMWEAALGSSKTERPLAQEALKKAPDKEARLTAALSSGQQEQRTIAAEWIGRLGLQPAIPALRTAIKKEKYDAPKAAMIGALERLAVPPDEFLDREALLAEARKIVSKVMPTALLWFPMRQLPVVHWSDNGAVVAPEIVQAWIISACKLKQAEPSALVRRYAASFRAEEREALGQFILDAWLAEDVMPHPRQVAEANAMASAQSYHQHLNYYPAYQGMTVEQIYARLLPTHLEVPRGTANDSKGILAVAGACVGGSAAAPVARYLKKWYGTRVHQARALLQMLAWVDHPLATQTLLAIGTRFRTKSLQEEATRLAQAIAERKGWSLAELADRTIPAAGLDDEGVLELDFGPRQFSARLDAALNFVLHDPDGKALKSLPDPRKDDDAEMAAAAKKQFAASRKELKQVLEQQRLNLYEAMCVQRTWRFEDWDPFLCRHPIVRHLCQRLVWTAARGRQMLTFRPLADGTLTDLEDNPVTLEPEDVIAIAHQSTIPASASAAWLRHLSDYEVTPLFDQFGRSAPEMTAERKKQREFKDFEGWMSDTFKIRGRATKLGYTRGAAEDGGWFYQYVKRFPTTGLQAEIEFTGSALPEENITAALTQLSFHRIEGHSAQALTLGEVPSVLLTECWNDFRQIAAEGSGYDPDWDKKARM